ncbi:flagellar basal body P-ring formation chaperone FlgA [Chenggangzhangella methanolivorans]|uniref:Flagellar basal body P-ring formation chaperone FlgA n=1 Tax=Chenggangzhangella methanolivorans TaxID=1437009 RepID=A0A9E6UIL3_9HYPH|nr:flagellar basal body P-ring formation chaperone FlgA [Chenggangzhangella methanolivorans]QZO00993.1 flagellar basal body P-ring formation chaperone FlgA [Chenggangzhangella methanolivorans]
MTRFACALALLPVLALPALSSPAFAQPTLRAEALVSGEIVTVGDLIDGAHGLEGVALFRAPDPGQTGPLPAAAAIAAARRAGVQGVEANGVREVFVTRASREVSLEQMTGAITARAATDYGCDVEAVETTLDPEMAAVHLDAGVSGALEVARFVVDLKTGRFDALLQVAGAARGTAPIRVTGAAVETVEVATLSRALSRGDIVSAADVRADRRPKAQAQDALRPTEVAGLAAKRALREDQPLRSGDLMRPQHVERGAFVTLIYATSGVSLSLKAKALAAGAAGDLITVQNLQSKRVVNGVVTGPSEVTVTSAPTALARR